MPRPRLKPGELGKISYKHDKVKKEWTALARLGRPDGRPARVIERTAATKADVYRALLLAAEDQRADQGGSMSATTTVRTLVHAWWTDSSPRWRPSTAQNYDYHVRLLDAAGVLDWPIGNVTPRMVDRVVSAISEPTTKHWPNGTPRTVGGPSAGRRVRFILREAFDVAVRDRAVETTPVMPEPRTKTTVTKEVTDLPPAELRRLRDRFLRWERETLGGGKRYTPMVDALDVLLGTGLRAGELLALRWQDVDLDAGTLEVNGTMVSVTGRGSYRQEGGKAAGSARVLELPRSTLDVLRRRHDFAGRPETGPVFPSRAGTHIQRDNFQKAWRRARGEDFADVTPHTVRRSVAGALRDAVSVEQASAQLGHLDSAVTEKYYLTRATTQGNAEALAKWLQRVEDGDPGDATGGTERSRPGRRK
ncbi:site-specific integrase [Kocuria rosea]|nr:site-specific integrase [Kocuria rosea]